MSWQEQLRKLDEELASGQISADDYRVRRDQVLSSAVSAGPEAQPRQPSAPGPTQLVPAPPPDGPAMPVPGRPDDADQTQIVTGDAPGGERTQAMGGWQATRPDDADAERTQAVPGVPPQSSASGQAPRPAAGQSPYGPPGFRPPQPGWGPHDDPSPPWAGTDFPPLAPSGNFEWTMQGPEVFEKTRSGGKRWAIVGSVVLLIAVIGVGFYFFAIKPSGDSANPPPSPSVSPESKAKTTSAAPKDDLPIPDLGGKVEDHKYVKEWADVPKAKFLTKEELDAYGAANPGKAKFAVFVQPDGAKEAVLLIVCSETKAKETRDVLAQLQVKYGFTARAQAPTGVTVAEIAASPDHPAIVRGHYVHEGVVVRLEVQGKELPTVVTQFDDMMSQQLRVMPPND